MRQAVALLCVLISAVALAQPTGEVERIGFGGYFRPDCWTPMLIRINPDPATAAGRYQIHIIQQDLDGDRPVYTRTVDIGPGDGPMAWWTYFIPEATGGGLPEVSQGWGLADLQQRLRVYVVDGRGRATMIRVGTTLISVDPVRSQFSPERGTRFVLCVGEPGRAQPNFIALTPQSRDPAVGIAETVTAVPVQPRELPDSVLGYDAVDAVVWFNAEPFNPNLPADAALWRALRDYVRQGGRLVICQSIDRDSGRFGELLPVTDVRVETRDDIGPLRNLAGGQQSRDWSPQRLPGPFRIARAQARPDAMVAEWVNWGEQRTPYIAHRAYGLGTVTWVAQDLGDPALTATAASGWAHVWDRVFDWRQNTAMPASLSERDRALWERDRVVFHDMGEGLFAGIEHGQRSAALMGLAVLFFIAYWLVAGPGVYLFLVNRKRAHMSWFAFGLSALVATAVTLVVVQLVLRGPPRLRHVTVLQQAADQPAVVHSRLGLYIPRDGMQRIEALDGSGAAVSAVTPLRMHPQHVRGEIDFPARQAYHIPVDEFLGGETPSVQVPFRSTLKKLEARWVGPNEAAVVGRPRLVGATGGYIGGPLTNDTGRTLRHVYFAFRDPALVHPDYLLYLPSWAEGATINLADEFRPGLGVRFVGPRRELSEPPGTNKVHGALATQWHDWWFTDMRGGAFTDGVRPGADSAGAFFTIMSLYSALPPTRPSDQPGTVGGVLSGGQRLELLRRASRHLDRSHALAAGQLVILAQADGPLPFALNVADERIGGEGRVYYQFVLPLERESNDLSIDRRPQADEELGI